MLLRSISKNDVDGLSEKDRFIRGEVEVYCIRVPGEHERNTLCLLLGAQDSSQHVKGSVDLHSIGINYHTYYIPS